MNLPQRGRGADAEVVFEKLLGGPHAKVAMAELSKSERGDESDTVKLSEPLYGRHRKVVFIGSLLFALQQLSGINAVFYFSSTVFKSAGVPSESANICVGIANLLGSLFAFLSMDKLGRKALLIASFSGMAAAMGIQATSASSLVSSSNVIYISVGGMLLFVFAFAMGAGPVPGLLLSEMFPGRIRAKAMSICMAVHWVFNFLVGLLFLRLLELLGPLLLNTIFATFCSLAVIFVKKNVLETKGKTLQEIEVALLPPGMAVSSHFLNRERFYDWILSKSTTETGGRIVILQGAAEYQSCSLQPFLLHQNLLLNTNPKIPTLLNDVVVK
ncbi:hypothetical protein V6N11_002854 [Hibiscus sabdariffa]|uniref:Major facilitator superfamily (MFS) profile domain-containing protein n=1 Tax=Hibiscus sabdariffa TaxID=183260 RepID=A0ABR2SBJ8_9ROSI